MTAPHPKTAPIALCLVTLLLTSTPLRSQFQPREPDVDRMLQQQAETDRTWKAASDGFMQMEKMTYRSRAGDLEIPAFVFQPLKLRGDKGHPALVWVHENIRGHLYEHYIPYIREATAKGYIVLAPEYRGSIGYGKAFYDAIDYGGAEVDAGVAAAQASAAQPTPAQTAPASSAAPAPRVRLVATGGTISNRTAERLTAEELVKSMPGIERYAQAEFEQFTNVASSQLTLEQWLALAKRLNELLATDAGLAGLVVTSGTDTLEELAYFLNLTVRSDKPVAVVGSMRNPSTLGYEGAANLLEGFRVAASPDARGKGVLVVLNDEINAAREVTKTDALRLNTFQSRGYGVLGVVDTDRVVFYRSVVKRHTSKSEFDVTSVSTLPRVDVILTYQGADGDLIKAAADRGAKGIVIAGAGAGATSGTQHEGIAYALKKGVFIVTTTRAGSGRIAPPRRNPNAPSPANTNNLLALTPEEQRRRIAGEDLLPVKARVLLMLALARTSDPAEIQRMFSEY